MDSALLISRIYSVLALAGGRRWWASAVSGTCTRLTPCLLGVLFCCALCLVWGVVPVRAGEEPFSGSALVQDPDAYAGAVAYEGFLSQAGPLPTGSGEDVLAVVLKYFGKPSCQQVLLGMQDTARKAGVALPCAAAGSEFDEQGQRARVAEALAGAPRVLVLSPLVEGNLSGLTVPGATILLYVDDVPQEGVTYYVGSNHYRCGTQAGELLTARFPGRGAVAVLTGRKESYSSRQRALGFQATVTASGFTVASEIECSWDQHQAYQATVGLMRQYPDLRAIYCVNDTMAIGAAHAVRLEGGGSRIAIFGTGGSPQALGAVQSGLLAGTVDCHSWAIGAASLDIALRLARGLQAPRVVHITSRGVSALYAGQEAE